MQFSVSIWASLGFQDSISFFIEQLTYFYDHSMLILILVSVVVMYTLCYSFFMVSFDRGLVDGHEVEFVWTILPSFLLVFIAFPSLKILYIIDECGDAFMTFKATGFQWYWVYEYGDIFDSDFGSYMRPFSSFRLLDCDDRFFVPFNIPVRLVVTSGDVIHSWTVPSLGVKADAVPGRLNQIILHCFRLGLYVGQCSEICGSGHSFMPIVLESVPVGAFL